MGIIFKILKLFREHKVAMIMLLLSSVSTLISLGMLVKIYSYTQQIELVTKETIHESATSKRIKKNIAVDISGALHKPGIIFLPQDSRLSDAIEKSGGLTSSAAMGYVGRTFNMSQILRDEQKIYIPTQLEVDEAYGSSGQEKGFTVGAD